MFHFIHNDTETAGQCLHQYIDSRKLFDMIFAWLFAFDQVKTLRPPNKRLIKANFPLCSEKNNRKGDNVTSE